METPVHADNPRILSPDIQTNFTDSILAEIDNEPWRDVAVANWDKVKAYVPQFVDLVQKFEQSALKEERLKITDDIDVIYIDSGPGPYSYKMLKEGKTDLDDKSYHKWKWSRKMDRARIRAAYVLASTVTAQRANKLPADLTEEDFASYSPTLMYTSTDWQAKHIRNAIMLSRGLGTFKIPDSKILMYEDFISRDGQRKPIVHTEDQVEGLQFPKNSDGTPPRRILMVSHPTHMTHLMYDLGKYPDSIPAGSTLQLFSVPTPKAAIIEYTKAEALGTLKQILVANRASLTPYTNYEL